MSTTTDPLTGPPPTLAPLPPLALPGLVPDPPQRPPLPAARSRVPAVAKRGLDVVASLLLLTLLSPLLLLIGVLVALLSKGPVLHRQIRVGREDRPFTILKFRTMHRSAEEHLRSDPVLWERWIAAGCKLPAAEDPRITGLGRLLRRTSLDELPQLVNVLRGDMSLVGPRPVAVAELDRHYRSRGLHRHYCACRPGITGLWQVSGRSTISYPERADLDVRYVMEWRLRGDLAILLRTIPTVLLGTGAH